MSGPHTYSFVQSTIAHFPLFSGQMHFARSTFHSHPKDQIDAVDMSFLLLPKPRKDGREPVSKPHDVLVRFGAASPNAVSELTSKGIG